jgi:hypothetical protein
MSDKDQRTIAQLRAYGPVLDGAAENASTSAAVAELVPTPPPRRRSRKLLVAAAAVAVLAVGAGALVARERDTDPDVRTNPSTVPAPATRPRPTRPPTTTAPKGAASARAPSFIVATADGVVRVDANGRRRPLVEGSVAVAVPDTTGGVVFQRAEGDTTLWHLPAGATEPVVALHANADETLELFDVAKVGADIVVVYTHTSHDETFRPQENDFDSPAQTLRITALTTRRTRVLAQVGGWEWGATSISMGGDRVAIETGFLVTPSWFADATTGFCRHESRRTFGFRDGNGSIVTVPGNPYTDQGAREIDPPCPQSPALAPDGTRFAYLQPGAGDPTATDGGIHDWRVTVVDARSGAKLRTVPVTFPRGDEDIVFVHSLDVAGDTVTINWTTAKCDVPPCDYAPHQQPALVVDLARGKVSTLPVAGTARAG